MDSVWKFVLEPQSVTTSKMQNIQVLRSVDIQKLSFNKLQVMFNKSLRMRPDKDAANFNFPEHR